MGTNLYCSGCNSHSIEGADHAQLILRRINGHGSHGLIFDFLVIKPLKFMPALFHGYYLSIAGVNNYYELEINQASKFKLQGT